jgi:hypothetical protein
MKLNADATEIVYSTFLGGSGMDFGHRIAVDPAGNAYVFGGTLSADFPVTPGSWQSQYGGEGQQGPVTYGDMFLAKIDPLGRTVAYSTYVGGQAAEEPLDIAVDQSGQRTSPE